MARPIFNLVLCFVCDKQANLGLVRRKVDTLSDQLQMALEPLKDHLKHEEEEVNVEEE